ncbi:uncharacterized protein LOC143289418 [Babylonia areolata]|uniref:uncharacterized protein LOC143289418 n=1 Tax=Babylonia areolata TaxID=304850 RepID=UPI003FD09DD2
MDTIKTLVIQQMQQMSDIAAIQDQVVKIIQSHDDRTKWHQDSQGTRRFLSRHFFVMYKETRAFLCLCLFLLFQLLLQLLFHGHFRQLGPYLPEQLQSLLLK